MFKAFDERGCGPPSVPSVDLGVVKKAESRKYHKVVSFFCGCGGLDLGFVGGFSYMGKEYKKNPYSILAAYDHDPKCIETYNHNIRTHGIVKDLTNFDEKTLPAADVLLGGFPCQDFATCGPRRGLTSVRGRLYRALIQYASHHKPKIIIGENVPGLVNLDNGRALETIEGDIREAGYRCVTWKMFAPEYGVPQNRSRLFIIGVRKDLVGMPEKPEPTHNEGGFNTIRWALEDLEAVLDDSIPNQSQYFKASKAKKGNGQGDEVSKGDRPAYTVRANAKSRVQFHYSLGRRLTVRECARLQTFPDSFEFLHSATANTMQIGNAVPPALGYIVAGAIDRFLRGK